MEIMKLSRGFRESEKNAVSPGAVPVPTPREGQGQSHGNTNGDPHRAVESNSQGLVLIPGQTTDLAPYQRNFGEGFYTATNQHSPPNNYHERPRSTTEPSSAEQRWTLGEVRQMLNALTAQTDLQEMKELITSLKIDISKLTEQVRILQGQHDYWRNAGIATEHKNVYIQDLSSSSHVPKMHERMPRTPTKTPSTSQHYPRLDRSPEEAKKSTAGVDAFGNLTQIKQELEDVESTRAISKLRRTLVYPQVPGDMFDMNDVHRNQKGTWLDQSTQDRNRIFQTESNSPPSYSKDHFTITSIKQEREDDCEITNSSKTSLLMLADIALGSPDEPIRRKIHKVLRETYRDSGRSSAESCFNSETSDDSDTLKSMKSSTNKSITKATYHQLYKSNSRLEKIKRPATPDSIEDETASKAMDSKMMSRKRRKMKQPLPCSYCGKLFQNQSSLRQHESFHLSVRPFVCEHDNCDKKYKTRSELNRHLVVHSGEKRHLCKLCGKRFLRKQYLKTHLLRHHQTGVTMESTNMEVDNDDLPKTSKITSSTPRQTEKKSYSFCCKLCMKVFSSDDDLSEHIKINHEEEKQGSVESQIDDSDKESNSTIGDGSFNTSTTSSEGDDITSDVQIKTPTLNIVSHS